MYSADNSLKYFCECGNNNLSSSFQAMNKLFGGKKTKKEDNAVASPPKTIKPLEVRREEVMTLRNRFPTKLPVIVQRFSKEHHLPHINKQKFLVPKELTMSQFMILIRNRVRVHSHQALYLMVNENVMVSLSLTMAEVYSNHANPDGYLYVTYASQEVFGGS
nr:microtubule-associated proteins 1A/1B light chain 3C-like [Leptinotarsa decemlineata]